MHASQVRAAIKKVSAEREAREAAEAAAKRVSAQDGGSASSVMADRVYEYGVFVNCPFDAEYRPLFRAIVFAIHDCGFAARSALEVTDASQVRIDKISAIIASSKFGLHDISRTELDSATGLPRFNMPLELGLFLGAKRFGTGKQKAEDLPHSRRRAVPISEVHLRHRWSGHRGA